MSNSVTRKYTKKIDLKYGCNPYQSNAALYTLNNDNDNDNEFPFEILNGPVGYINVLDALNAWNLVCELKRSLHLEAAASFKHTSPAGVAIYSDSWNTAGDDLELSKIALTYLKARDCDPKSSFGDFLLSSRMCLP